MCRAGFRDHDLTEFVSPSQSDLAALLQQCVCRVVAAPYSAFPGYRLSERRHNGGKGLDQDFCQSTDRVPKVLKGR